MPASTIPVELIGGGVESLEPVPDTGKVVRDSEKYDVVIIGGGLAGLSSAVYLTDHGKKVLLLEKENHLGGLAAWGEEKSHVRYDRGAAYWTSAYEEELAILKHIGLGDFEKKNPIPEPIDSYFVRGKFYPGIWDEKTLQDLPASFALFRYELQKSNEDKMIPNQPFEEFAELDGGSMALDGLSTRAWIEGMPASMRARKLDAAGAAILARFQASHLPGPTGMEDVVELMDLYCRSALGTTTDYASAMAFANFYISEIETRYTTPQGTGVAADHMRKMLEARPKLFRGLLGAPVGKGGITDWPQGVEVRYNYQGHVHRVKAGYAVFSAQLKLAPDLIKGFSSKAPEQASLMKSLGYSNYSVHILHIKGQPYRSTYDTWTRAADYSDKDFTDVILGQWTDPKIRGYEGTQDFAHEPAIRDGILSIYHPLSTDYGYTDEDAKALALGAAKRMQQVFAGMPSARWHGPVQIEKIETSRWPWSVHIASPGHYLTKARVLRKPFGHVFFAHSNLGTPAFEEALFRGHCAADNILARMGHGFKREKWSRCVIE
ncbi:MAG: FAD-dependent oxidoreductase [Bdellovibrionota bacterium]